MRTRPETENLRWGGWGRGDAAVLAGVVGVVAAVYLPMLATGSKIPAHDDFLQYAFRQEFLRKSLFTYGVFPLRSHFFGSGYPLLGDPEDPALQPFTWVLLPFSSVFALKLRVVVCAVLSDAQAAGRG